MNILLLAPHPYYQERGTCIDVDLLVRGLSRRGDTVDVVTYHEGTDVDYPHVTIHRIRAWRWIRGIRPGFSFKKLFCDVLLFFLAWRLVSRNKYDVIHADEEAVFAAMFFRLFYRVPYVYDMDSSIAQQMVEKMKFLWPLRWAFSRCERSAIRHSLAVAPVCHALADLARDRGARKVFTLHDISQLSRLDFEHGDELRRKLGIRGVMAAYVGNLEPYQGIDLLLESMQVARQTQSNLDLVIAGGQQKHIVHYRKQAQRLGLGRCVHFIGPWPAQRLGNLLGQADFLVCPRSKGINTPMKIFPYLHSGRAVLATDLPTHSQLLDDSIALLAPATPQGFGAGMAQLAADGQLRERLGSAGRRFVEANHTLPQYEHRLDSLYDFVAASCSPSSSAQPPLSSTPSRITQ